MNDFPSSVDLHVAEFPAPVCDRCAIPMWSNKRIDCSTVPHRVERLSYECPVCHAVLRMRSRTKMPAAAHLAAS